MLAVKISNKKKVSMKSIKKKTFENNSKLII